LKASVYVRPATTGEAVPLHLNVLPFADKLRHSPTTFPRLSRSAMLTLSIRVVPAAPLIVSSQIALVPENPKFSVCPLVANGSIATAAATVMEKHTTDINIAAIFKIRFIACPPVFSKIFEVYFRPL
jgi:hypothetical protein